MSGISTISEKIRSLRQLRGYSQQNMADSLGVSVNAYSKIECGDTDVSWSRLEQIAKIFEIPISELVSFGEKPFYYFNNHNHGRNKGSYIVSLNTDGNEWLVELERYKIQSESQKKELQHLQKIITLLEEQITHLKRTES
jgi:transcriptional regulator with XRE-family HTH domain